jgi:hypothetical protein
MTAVIPSSLCRRRRILRVLEDCPEELAELRAALLQQEVWTQAEGL